MRIDKVEIDAFGKLNNCSYSFLPGINLVYGKNESGKSTLCEFILAMFYGIPNESKKNGTDMPVRKKYRPWTGDTFGGRVYFTADDGKKYVIERSFKATKRGDKATLRNADTWEEVGDAENAGEKFFGLSREGFLRTLYVRSLGADSLKTDDGEIMSRLSNLETSGDEDVSYSKIINIMEKDIFALRTKTGRGGKIAALEDKITALKNEKTISAMTFEALDNSAEEVRVLNQRIEQKEKEAKNLEQKYQTALQHEEYISYKKLAETKNLITNRIKTETEKLSNLKLQLEKIDETKETVSAEKVNRARTLETKKLMAEQRVEKLKSFTPETKKSGAALIFLILGTLVLIAGVFTDIVIAAVVAVISFAVAAALIIIQRNKEDKAHKEKQENIEAALRELKEIETELEEIFSPYNVTVSDELSALFVSYQSIAQTKESLEKQIDECQKEVRTLEENIPQEVVKTEFSEEAIDYSGEAAKEIFEKISQLKSESKGISEQAHEISVRLAKETAEIRNQEEIDREINDAEEELKTCEERYNSLMKAAEWLNMAHTEIKNNFAPRLNSKASEFLRLLTNERYGDIRANDAFGINLKSTVGEIVEAECMSRGTYDLMYIALRFASMSVLTDGKIPPVILDDAFSQLDDERLLSAVKLITSDNEFSQILLFTCHENYKEVLKNFNITELK